MQVVLEAIDLQCFYENIKRQISPSLSVLLFGGKLCFEVLAIPPENLSVKSPMFTIVPDSFVLARSWASGDSIRQSDIFNLCKSKATDRELAAWPKCRFTVKLELLKPPISRAFLGFVLHLLTSTRALHVIISHEIPQCCHVVTKSLILHRQILGEGWEGGICYLLGVGWNL